MSGNVRKLHAPHPDIPGRNGRKAIRLGRCDSFGAIRRALRRVAQAVADGEIEPPVGNAVGFALGLTMKAFEREREFEPKATDEKTAAAIGAAITADMSPEEAARTYQELINGTWKPAPVFNVSFEDGGPGDYGKDIEVSPKLPQSAPAPDNTSTPAPCSPAKPIAAPAPSPEVSAAPPKLEVAPPAPKPKPKPAEVTKLEPRPEDVLPRSMSMLTLEQTAELALHKAVGRQRIADLQRQAEEQQRRNEQQAERERAELAIREANMAKERW